jgi:hypothetical protein
VSRDLIVSQIEDRCKEAKYGDISVNDRDAFKNKVKNCDVLVISFEEWIKKLKAKEVIREFYGKCLFHNKIKSISGK